MKLLRIACLVPLLCFFGSSLADSISFGLNQNNVGFANSIDYATVTISHNPLNADHIDFLVELNHGYFDTGSNFGLQAFYFNSAVEISGVGLNGMAGWRLGYDFGTGPGDGFEASDFGRFDIEYASIGYYRADPLRFTLMAEGDSLLNYALDNAQGFAFAAHITDYDNGLGGNSGWFSTSTSPVPVPAAVWLFGSAIIGMIGFTRKRSTWLKARKPGCGDRFQPEIQKVN